MRIEMAENFKKRTECLHKISGLCKELGAFDTDIRNNDQKQAQLVQLWKIHALSLDKLLIGSEFDLQDFLNALFPSLNKGNADVIECALDNFEFFLSVVGDSLIPNVMFVIENIEHKIDNPSIFYRMMAMIVKRYGKYFEFNKDIEKYVDNFKENKILEALEFFTEMLIVYGLRLKESAARLLELLSENDQLCLNSKYVRCINAFYAVRFDELPLKQVVEKILRQSENHTFIDPDYENELDKCRILYK